MQYFIYFEFKINLNAFNIIDIWDYSNSIGIIIAEICVRTRDTISKENECVETSEQYLSFI